MRRARGRHCVSTTWMLAFLWRAVLADESTHTYTVGEQVNLWVNKVGPLHNPQETYPYYRLPFCKPHSGIGTKKKGAGIGEILEGNELRNSAYSVHFTQEVERMPLCKEMLSEERLLAFRQAVAENYWYNMYLDDLPIWGMVGRVTPNADGSVPPPPPPGQRDDRAMEIYTHRRLDIAFNLNRIIEVNLTSEVLQPLVEGRELEFSYQVHWAPTVKEFADRFGRYLDYSFFEHQIHWFSIFNSFMMVIFLCGLVALILVRTLRNDFAKYTKYEEDLEGVDSGMAEDSGWKQVHGDVFRAPPWLMLFSALYGTGCQLVALVGGVVLFAMAGPLHGDVYEERGEMVTTFIVVYALTSAVAGYASGSYYRQYFPTPRAEQGSRWQRVMLLTVLLLPTVVVGILAGLNMIALYYDTINTIPFLVIIKMFAIWLFVSLPLAVAGTLFGRHWGGKGSFPCRVNSIPRPVPAGPWYTHPLAVIPLTGVLPFGSIFIEMYFIFTSFWNYKFYYVYGFMLLVYAILAVVVVCTTIVAVYFVLNAEDHRWQWLAFMSSGSTAGYVFLYAVYYFYFRTQMEGFLQVAFYFGYMTLFCTFLFILCGTLGVFGATVFVKAIYRHIKVD